MMQLKVVTLKNLRDVHGTLSTKLSIELDDKVTDGGIQNDEISGFVTQMGTDIIN